MIRNLIIAFAALAFVLWIGFAYWVNKDARRRIRSRFLIGLATLLGLVPFLGPLLYLLVRPAETRADVRSRNAELAALEAHLARRSPTCPECAATVEAGFLVCPVCSTRLREPCAQCAAPLEPLWQMCPYCATPVEAQPDLDMTLTRAAGSTTALGLVAQSAEV